MSKWEFTLPTAIFLPRVKDKDKRFSVDLNAFRRSHHRTYTEAKTRYKFIVSPQFKGLEKPHGKIHIHYELYIGRDNKPDLDNFVGAAKKFFQDAMVQCGFIEEDNITVIVSSSEEFCGIDRENPHIIATIMEIK